MLSSVTEILNHLPDEKTDEEAYSCEIPGIVRTKNTMVRHSVFKCFLIMSDKDRNVVKVFGLFCRLKIILKEFIGDSIR